MSAEAISVITLKCASCAGLLEVTPYVDMLTCGYCGSAQQAVRKGNFVSLSLLQEVSHVTGRAAAELAIQRLQKELQGLYYQKPLIENDGRERLEAIKKQFNNRALFAAMVPFAAGIMFQGLLKEYMALTLLATVAASAMCAVAMLTFARPGRDAKESVIKQEVDAHLSRIDQRIQWTHAAIQHNTQIANS